MKPSKERQLSENEKSREQIWEKKHFIKKKRKKERDMKKKEIREKKKNEQNEIHNF